MYVLIRKHRTVGGWRTTRRDRKEKKAEKYNRDRQYSKENQGKTKGSKECILFEKFKWDQQWSRGTRSRKGILSCKEKKYVIYIKNGCHFKREAYKHFKFHFGERPLLTPPEIEDPENIEYLQEKCQFIIDESPAPKKEVRKVLKGFKNGNSPGTHNIKMGGLKYYYSESLIHT